MTFPQPAGYYGLQLSEQLEAKITSFNQVALAATNADVAIYLNERIYEDTTDVTFDSSYLSGKDDRFIESLTNSELIAFQRWICDRLAFLHTVPVQAEAK